MTDNPRSGALRILALIVLWLATAGAAAGQGPTSPPPSSVPPSISGLSAQLDADDDHLRSVFTALRSRTITEDGLRAAIAAIPPIKAQLNDAISDLSPRLESMDARLAELGPAPAAGETAEQADIAHSRSLLTRYRAIVDADIKRARFLLVEADQLSSSLSNRARMLFSARLWTHNDSVLSPALWQGFIAALPGDFIKLGALVRDELRQLSANTVRAVALPTLIIGGAVALAILVPLRIGLAGLGRKVASSATLNTRFRRSALAVWLVLVSALTPLLAGIVLREAFANVGGFTAPFDRLVVGLIRALTVGATIEALGRATLSPKRPSWRLAPLPDAVVAKLAPFPLLIGLSSALAYSVAAANAAAGSSPSTAAAGDCVTVLFQLAALSATLISLGRARVEGMAPEQDTGERPQTRLPWIITAILAWAALGASLLAVLVGYLALASFIMRETIWIGMVLAALFLLIRFVDDLFPTLLSPDRSIGRSIRIAVGFSPGALEQIGVLLSGLFRLAILVVGWGVILLPFGASAGDAFGRLSSSELVIHLGQVAISPATILGAVAVFVIGIGATRAVRGWLETRYLPKTRMDAGVRSAFAAAITYIGGLIALVATSSYLGLSLDKIALFASALSVGIGFGLQSVIGNFVSGLILLLERPVKVGDWIAIDGKEGDVRRVSVRATEIEMTDRSRLIVPNSDLISKVVRNVTAHGAIGQVKIALPLDARTDPQVARGVILEVAKHHAEVLGEPAAGVYLTEAKDGALNFSMIAYVASPRHVFRIKSELLFEIIPALAKMDIALASSTPIVNVPAPPPPAASSSKSASPLKAARKTPEAPA
jgi:potassium efflux system protein